MLKLPNACEDHIYTSCISHTSSIISSLINFYILKHTHPTIPFIYPPKQLFSMAFQDIAPIEKPQFFLDLAFRHAKQRAEDLRSKKLTGDRIKIVIQINLIKIDVVQSTLHGRFSKILKQFPQIDDLDPFYQGLVKTTMNYVDVKQALGALNWALKKIKALTQSYKAKIKMNTQYDRFPKLFGEYVGRISSVVKQIKEAFKVLDEARKILRQFPNVKTSLPTVAIVGFPNIGKTTLLFKLTGSKPDIQEYAFTTKNINIAYLKKEKKKIQFLDTPGTLNREKNNRIEQQAYLALKHVTDIIIYIFDITEPYPLKDQKLLLEKTKEFKKPIILYLSKTDLLKPEQIEAFQKEYEVTTNLTELKKTLLKKI